MPHNKKLGYDLATVSEPAADGMDVQTNPFAKKIETSKPPSTPRETLFASVHALVPDSFWSHRAGRKEKYPSRLVGKGGEHLVFEFDDVKHRGIVHKINFLQTLPILRAHLAGEIQRKKALEQMEEAMLERLSQLKELRQYFGASAVPMQRFLIRDVPVTREIVDQLFPGSIKENEEIPKTLPAWGSIQHRVDLPPKTTVSLTANRYPENRIGASSKRKTTGFKGVYDASYDILVGKKVAIDPAVQRSHVLNLYPALHQIAEKVEDDPSFKAKLRETVIKLIAYSDDTKVALDFVGENNIALVQSQNGWELKMPDPLPLYDYTFFDLQIACQALKLGKPVPEDIRGAVKNALNTVRVINALALLSGVTERLRVPSLETVSGIQWRREFELE